jgi:hypothetical protein
MYLTAKKQKLIIVLFFGLTFALLPFITSAQTHVGFQYASELGLGTRDLRSGIVALVNILLGMLGTIAVVIIMYGGFVWMTSAGDPNKIENARKILINAGVGLTIVLSSWGIVSLIFSFFGIGGNGGGGGGVGIVYGTGPRALGSGIIQTHYPARSQTDVPRNTKVSITFKEKMSITTICSSDPCNGVGINDANIKIFKNTDGETLALTSAEVLVSADADTKTFVFSPVKYLGDSNNNIWYTVRLRDGVKKMDGTAVKDAFFGVIGGIGYEWQFEVSSKIDLTPPQVSSIIPNPDDSADTYTVGVPAQATGSITVNSVPKVHTPATVGAVNIITGVTPPATVSGIYTGKNDETLIKIIIINDGGLKADVDWASVNENDKASASITNNVVALGSGLTFSIGLGYSVGNEWHIGGATAEVQPDYLRVGNTNYEFVASGASGNQINIVSGSVNGTATNIKNVIDLQGQITATATTLPTIDITADIAGSAGNGIVLSSTSSSAFTFVNMNGGTSAGTVQDCQPDDASCDQPRNAVVQINFDEPIDPTVSTGVYALCVSDADCAKYGMSTAVGSCVANFCSAGSANFDNIKLQIINYWESSSSSMVTAKASSDTCAENFECESNYCNAGNCVGEYISGTFVQSNNYKTVEFVTFDKCGVNSCGEDVYCLPKSANIEVLVDAATLKNSCAGLDSNCTDGNYSTCDGSGTCKDSGGNFSPQAFSPVAGIVDMALNTLDGDKDGVITDIASYYDENIGAPDGDSYSWSFFTSDKVDLTAPTIKSIFPPIKGVLNMDDPIEVLFSKLMMSSKLRPDGGYGDGKEHLSIIDNSASPIGYWVTSKNVDEDLPKDNVPDKTKAYINHTSLISSSGYRARIGEGVKDLYQNCFVPAKDNGVTGSTCNTVGGVTRYCCNGVPTDPASLPVDANGHNICN